MRPDIRSVSFTWHRSKPGNGPVSRTPTRKTRRRLQDKFDMECEPTRIEKSSPNGPRARWGKLNLSSMRLSPIQTQTRRVLRSGAETLSKTINGVKTTFGTLSQKFRSSTRRRYRLNECAYSPVTPQSRARRMLGRTPTKLYSPFGIDSPFDENKENRCSTVGRYTPKRSRYSPNGWENYNPVFASTSKDRTAYVGRNHPRQPLCALRPVTIPETYSPTQQFPKDIQSVKTGVKDFERAAQNVMRRSVRIQAQ